MAIIVEQQKQSKISIFYILGWIIFIFIVMIGIYYVFFEKPEIYEKVTEQNLAPQDKDIEELIKIKSKIDTVSPLEGINKLKQYITIPQDIPSGKENPFF